MTFDFPKNGIQLENNKQEDIEVSINFLIQYLKNKNYIKLTQNHTTHL